jgi:hypothetical protein
MFFGVWITIPTTGACYAPARIDGDCWDLEKLLRFLIADVAALCQNDVYIGRTVKVELATLAPNGHGKVGPIVEYAVTGSYLKGLIWEFRGVWK